MMTSSAQSHLRKWLLPTLAATLYVSVLVDTFVRAPGLASAHGWSWWQLWLTLYASSLIALCFLAAAILVWLYERQRVLAFVVFAFCASLMVLFLFETLGLLDDPWGSFGSSVATSFALVLLLIVACIFPQNRLKVPTVGGKRTVWARGLLILVAINVVQATLSSLIKALAFHHSGPAFARYPGTVFDATFATVGMLLSTVLTILIMAYSLLHTRTPAERQQLRIIVWGALGSFIPLLALTAIPTIIAATIKQQPLIDVRLSTLSLVLFPLAISYAVLRYRLLILDRFILSIIRSIMWLITVVLFSYLAVTVATALFVGEARLLSILLSLVVVVPSASWCSTKLAQWVLLPDVTHSHHLLYEQQDLPHTSSVAELATLFCATCYHMLGSDRVVLFLLDSEAGAFKRVTWSAPSSEALGHWSPVEAAQEARWRDVPPFLVQEWMEDDHPFVQRVLKGKRPFLLGEAIPTGWGRVLLSVLNSSPTDLLVVPLTIHDTLLGFGLLGSREETYGYAGPDMSVADTIAHRFAPPLEEAIMTDVLSHRARVLEALSSVLNDTSVAHTSLEAMADVIAPRVAAALQVQCEVWKYVPLPQPAHVRRLTSSGTGPALSIASVLPMAAESDWQATFWEGGRSFPDTLPGLPHRLHPPTFPVAWLPLTNAQHRYGVLALTYDRPHRFSPEEQHVLHLLVQQWVGAFERASELEILHARLQVQHKQAQERQTSFRHDLFSILAALRSVQWLLSGQSGSPRLLRAPTPENRTPARSPQPFVQVYEPQLTVNAVLQSLLAGRHHLVNGGPPGTVPGVQSAHREVLLIVGNTPLQSLLIDACPLLGYTPAPVPTVQAGFARLYEWSQHETHDKRAILVLETMLGRAGSDSRSFARLVEHVWKEQGDVPMPALVVIREQEDVGETPLFPTLVLPFSLAALQGVLA